jgi:hypothetical protein
MMVAAVHTHHAGVPMPAADGLLGGETAAAGQDASLNIVTRCSRRQQASTQQNSAQQHH